MKLFANDSFQKLEQSLNYASLKQRVISQNIANVDTPKYKAKKISFKTELADASIEAARTHQSHIPFRGGDSESPISIKTQRNTSYNHNGNNVDIDAEMAEMAKNQIYYNVLVDRMNGKFNSIKEVLKGGS